MDIRHLMTAAALALVLFTANAPIADTAPRPEAEQTETISGLRRMLRTFDYRFAASVPAMEHAPRFAAQA